MGWSTRLETRNATVERNVGAPALSNPAAWAYLAPIVIENGGWALFITTARGRNHAKSMLDMARARDDWFSEVLPVNVTGAMSEAAVEQQPVEYTGVFGKEAADALIDQEYYCSFEAAILGAHSGKEMLLAEQQGRICDVPVNPDLSVQTAWNIGVDDAMAIWCFQVYPDHIDVADYYEGHGMGFDHYCEWLDARGYHGIDWMPHDAKVREAGAPGARPRIETLVGGLVSHPPRRTLGPTFQCLFGPLNGLICVAEGAGVRNVERLCRSRGDEAEGMGVHFHAPERLFDQRHMTGDALAARAIQLVMRVGLYSVGKRTDRRVWPMATQAKRVALLPQHRGVVAAVRIVT